MSNRMSTSYGHRAFTCCAPNVYVVYANVSADLLTTTGNTYVSVVPTLYVSLMVCSVLKSTTNVSRVSMIVIAMFGYTCVLCFLPIWFLRALLLFGLGDVCV